MERYIGIDVHAQSCTVAVMGPSGKRLGTEVVETKGKALLEAVQKVKGQRFVCIEEGTQSEWLYELLQPHVEDLVVILAPETRGNKSDQRDSWKLAETARAGKTDKRVFKAPSAFAGLRAASRGYRMLSKDVTRAKNRLRAVYRSRGVSTEGDEVYRADQRERWLLELPASSRGLAELLGAELDALVPLKKQAEQWLNEEAKAHPAVSRLRGVPGLGIIRAAQVVAVIMTPYRFRTNRQLWNYSGLGVVSRTSADWIRGKQGWIRAQVQKTRGLNRDRNATLKSVFKSAATTVITRMIEHPLRKDYERTIQAGTKPNLAKLTLARRIAAICLAIWKKQEDYDPQKHQLRPRQPA